MTHQNPSLGMCWKLFWATLSSFDNGLSNRYLFQILILQGRFQFCICLFQDGTPNLHAILLSSFFPSDSFSLHCKFLFSLLSCRFCASSSSACSLCTVSCFWASSFSFRSFSIHSIMGMCRISQAFSNCHSLSDLICGTNILHTKGGSGGKGCQTLQNLIHKETWKPNSASNLQQNSPCIWLQMMWNSLTLNNCMLTISFCPETT